MAEAQVHDAEALIRKNAELLGEIKGLKAKIATLEQERDAALQSAETSGATMRKVLLDDPLERTLGQVFSLPWRHMRPLLEEHFEFALGDDGKPTGKAKSGGEAMTLDEVRAAFAAIPDLAVIMRPAQGGGAKGMDRPVEHRSEKLTEAKVAPSFGLR